MIAFATPPVPRCQWPVVLLERFDDVNRAIALAASLRDRARQHTERAWVEMCLRDRHPRGTWAWLRWDALMRYDTAHAAALAWRCERSGC